MPSWVALLANATSHAQNCGRRRRTLHCTRTEALLALAPSPLTAGAGHFPPAAPAEIPHLWCRQLGQAVEHKQRNLVSRQAPAPLQSLASQPLLEPPEREFDGGKLRGIPREVHERRAPVLAQLGDSRVPVLGCTRWPQAVTLHAHAAYTVAQTRTDALPTHRHCRGPECRPSRRRGAGAAGQKS